MRFVFHSWISIPQISEENARSSDETKVSVQSRNIHRNESVQQSIQAVLRAEQEWCGLDKESACRLGQSHAYSEISFANFG
jgi:hypothetical protein